MISIKRIAEAAVMVSTISMLMLTSVSYASEPAPFKFREKEINKTAIRNEQVDVIKEILLLKY